MRRLWLRSAGNRTTPPEQPTTPTPVAAATPQEPVFPAHARPIWFLDVDGVLAPYTDCGDTYLYWHSQGGSVPFRRAVVDRIARLHTTGAVEVHWLTTWGAEELEEWHRVGLYPLPVGDRDTEGPFSWWKANIVLAYLDAHPTRRVVWTDDDIEVNPHRAGRIREAGGDRLLALAPDRDTGLTDEDLDCIETWLISPHR